VEELTTVVTTTVRTSNKLRSTAFLPFRSDLTETIGVNPLALNTGLTRKGL
jgi:hypothetical protein